MLFSFEKELCIIIYIYIKVILVHEHYGGNCTDSCHGYNSNSEIGEEHSLHLTQSLGQGCRKLSCNYFET